MALPLVSQAADEFLPPGNSAAAVTTAKYQAGITTSVTTSAAAVDIFATLRTTNGNPAAGGFWVTFQARGSNVYLRFGPTSTTATTAGAAGNGYKISADGEKSFWITQQSRWMDIIGDAACSLFWWASSPNYTQRDYNTAGTPV